MALKDGVYVRSKWTEENECGSVHRIGPHTRECTMPKGHDTKTGHRDSFGWWKS